MDYLPEDPPWIPDAFEMGPTRRGTTSSTSTLSIADPDILGSR
jgi:hypothetical protein